jgi:hypothetical protein
MRLVVEAVTADWAYKSRFISAIGTRVRQVLLEDFRIPYWVEVGMGLGLLGGETLLQHTLG